MGGANQPICQLESIRYLHGTAPYTYLMIDESQLLFMQTASKTLPETPDVQIMWDVFTSLITNAKFIRLYDGFMGRTSMDVLKGMGIQDVAVVRMPSSVPNNGRTMTMESADSSFETMEWLKASAASIGEQVRAGKNVLVFYQFRNEDKYNRWPSMKPRM